MKLGIITMFAIYIVFRWFFNITTSVLFIQKKVSASTMSAFTTLETFISLFFTIMIIRMAVQSGGRA